jgi:hypothetical protein
MLKGQFHEIFHQSIPPGPLIHRLIFLTSDLYSRKNILLFNHWFPCLRCQWHRIHEIILLDSPHKFILFCSGGVGHFT